METDEITRVAQGYQEKLNAKIANLFNLTHAATTSSATKPAPSATLPNAPVSFSNNAPTIEIVHHGNMDRLEAKLHGNNKTQVVTSTTKQQIGILDLQLSNVALCLVLMALLSGTIYYWVWSPSVKDRKKVGSF